MPSWMITLKTTSASSWRIGGHRSSISLIFTLVRRITTILIESLWWFKPLVTEVAIFPHSARATLEQELTLCEFVTLHFFFQSFFLFLRKLAYFYTRLKSWILICICKVQCLTSGLSFRLFTSGRLFNNFLRHLFDIFLLIFIIIKYVDILNMLQLARWVCALAVLHEVDADKATEHLTNYKRI